MRLLPLLSIPLAVGLIAAAPAKPVVVEASWKDRPSGESVNRLYPEAAMKAGVGGKAKVRCTITVEGELKDCAVVEETPEGFGFGEASVRLLATSRFNPKTIDGKPVESEKVIPMSFAKPEGPYRAPTPIPDAAQSMACLGLALDDLEVDPGPRARDLASLWYSLASFNALPRGGKKVGDFLQEVEESRNRAARLRDDQGQARQRQTCEALVGALYLATRRPGQ